MDEKTLLEIKDLAVEFRTEEGIVRAVNNISYTLNKGETLGIVGETGSGKSVSSLAVMGLIPNPPGKIVNGSIHYRSPVSGEVTDLLNISEGAMRKFRGNEISMIFQEPMTSLNPVYTCCDQVMEAIMLHQKVSRKEARERTLELFKSVLLPRPENIIDSYPHQVSGGQKQRVMIAMAMSCNPSILFADEPTTALDVTVQDQILKLMLKLQQENETSTIFITHDLGVIAEIADKVVVMYKGNIVEQGPVLDIFTNPTHPYTKGLMACRPPLDKRLHRLPTMRSFMTEKEDGSMEGIDVSVDEVIKKVEIPQSETEARHKKLFSQDPILQVKNLKTYFPVKKGFFRTTVDYVRAVDDVSFEVYPGETLGLVGESGCGKTTLGRTILRLVEPTEGEIIYNERNVRELDAQSLRALRKDMQIIFQDPYSSLNPRISVGSAIMEPMKVHNLHSNDKGRKKRVIELLERVGLGEEHFKRYPHEFSGGQRQRICIARALAVNPKFIICDESVSALDVSVQAQVLNLLIELREEFNFTYIFISHDLSVVKFMSDRMIVMNEGKIEEIDKADKIYYEPQREYTQRLIDAIPKGEVEDIKKGLEKRGHSAKL